MIPASGRDGSARLARPGDGPRFSLPAASREDGALCLSPAPPPPTAPHLRRDARRGFSLIEVVVVAGLVVILLVTVWRVFGAFMGTTGKTGVTRLTDKSMIQRELRLALRKLMQRLREASEILDPPGQTVETLRFADILSNEVRLRIDADKGELVSERLEGGAYVLETQAAEVKTDDGGAVRPAHPIRVRNCEKASFTILTPTCVIVHLSLASGKMKDTMMFGLHLRNYGVRQ